MTTTKTRVLLAALVTLAVLHPAGTAAIQNLQTLRADWRDLETWSKYLDASRETELGLGLQVTGPTGTTFVSFTGRLSVRNPTVPPTEVTVQIGASRLSNPNIVRRPTFILDADPDTEGRVRFDLSKRMTVDDPTPGAIVESGLLTLKATEFARLCDADILTGEALGFALKFRNDQIAAMRALGDRLHLIEDKAK